MLNVNNAIHLIRNIKVKKGIINFYLALLGAMFYFFTFRKIINPACFYLGESIVIVDKKKLILNRYTSFGFYLNLEYFEPETYNIIRRTTGKTFIDVGANAGGYSIRFSSNFEQIIAIEPDSRAFSVLLRNIKLNSIENISPLNISVSNFIGKAKLYYKTTSTQVSSLNRNWRYLKDQKVISEEVNVSTLDKITSNINEISLLKIDAEGEAYKILLGAENTLEKTKAIIIEVDDDYYLINDLLKNKGFKTILIDSHKESQGNLYGYKTEGGVSF